MKYFVVGGQYHYRCYGSCDTIQAAKRLASKSEEYWDNWQGFHTPSIYTEDQIVDGHDLSVARPAYAGCVPFAMKKDGKWLYREGTGFVCRMWSLSGAGWEYAEEAFLRESDAAKRGRGFVLDISGPDKMRRYEVLPVIR